MATYLQLSLHRLQLLFTLQPQLFLLHPQLVLHLRLSHTDIIIITITVIFYPNVTTFRSAIFNYSNTTKKHTAYRRFSFTSEAFIRTDFQYRSSVCKGSSPTWLSW